MKRVISILFVIVTSGTLFAHDNWVCVGLSSDSTHFLLINSKINKGERDGTYYVWVKTILYGKAKEERIKLLSEVNSKLAPSFEYDEDLFLIDIMKDRYKRLSTIEYTENGEVIDSDNIETAWDYSVPDSIIDAVIDLVKDMVRQKNHHKLKNH
jgi:hypothetical protein